MKTEDSTQPDFWNTRYAAGKTPWDLGSVPAALRSFLARAKPPGRVLIPGCGSGYEVQVFHDAGFEVTAIDFSPAARERAARILGPLIHCVIAGDFFTHDFSGQEFDLIYERTFLCSLPPERWPAYARRMAELLQKGKILAGIFLYGEEPEPPPFPLTEAQASDLLGDDFQLVRSEPISDSLPLFQGMERWQEWRRK
ncbi:MAG TPA: methyltransferase domain-containing protein [Chthoniobacterales bacterium]|nr:methyltransferase domain-containing protein [Chthoniobacterales bacterium]